MRFQDESGGDTHAATVEANREDRVAEDPQVPSGRRGEGHQRSGEARPPAGRSDADPAPPGPAGDDGAHPRLSAAHTPPSDARALETLIVHPGCDLPYASFVLQGFADVLGPSRIRYSTEGFPARFNGGRVLAFYRGEEPEAKGFVSFTDQTAVHRGARAWARVYGAVNVEPEHEAGACPVEEGIVPLGPTFGVRLRSAALTRRHVAGTWRWARRNRVRLAVRQTRAVLRHQRRRTYADAYVPRPADPDYVFFAAWPWAKHTEVNPPRARFIEACRRAPGLTFEGGFAPRRRRDVADVVHLSAAGRYSIQEYIAKLQRSAVAFNNPAVHGCLGWKLGEFLALGKAVITLPLGRALPAPLEHGVHLHVIDGSPASIDDALGRLRRDHAYRQALETNARLWYDEHLAPAQVARRLLTLLES